MNTKGGAFGSVHKQPEFIFISLFLAVEQCFYSFAQHTALSSVALLVIWTAE